MTCEEGNCDQWSVLEVTRSNEVTRLSETLNKVSDDKKSADFLKWTNAEAAEALG